MGERCGWLWWVWFIVYRLKYCPYGFMSGTAFSRCMTAVGMYSIRGHLDMCT